MVNEHDFLIISIYSKYFLLILHCFSNIYHSYDDCKFVFFICQFLLLLFLDSIFIMLQLFWFILRLSSSEVVVVASVVIITIVVVDVCCGDYGYLLLLDVLLWEVDDDLDLLLSWLFHVADVVIDAVIAAVMTDCVDVMGDIRVADLLLELVFLQLLLFLLDELLLLFQEEKRRSSHCIMRSSL